MKNILFCVLLFVCASTCNKQAVPSEIQVKRYETKYGNFELQIDGDSCKLVPDSYYSRQDIYSILDKKKWSCYGLVDFSLDRINIYDVLIGGAEYVLEFDEGNVIETIVPALGCGPNIITKYECEYSDNMISSHGMEGIILTLSERQVATALYSTEQSNGTVTVYGTIYEWSLVDK